MGIVTQQDGDNDWFVCARVAVICSAMPSGRRASVSGSLQHHHRQLLMHSGMDEQSRLVSQSASAQKRINSTRQEETERPARPTRTVVAPSEAGSPVESGVIAMLQELSDRQGVAERGSQEQQLVIKHFPSKKSITVNVPVFRTEIPTVSNPFKHDQSRKLVHTIVY
jgi:hypothetical protein